MARSSESLSWSSANTAWLSLAFSFALIPAVMALMMPSNPTASTAIAMASSMMVTPRGERILPPTPRGKARDRQAKAARANPGGPFFPVSYRSLNVGRHGRLLGVAGLDFVHRDHIPAIQGVAERHLGQVHALAAEI